MSIEIWISFVVASMVLCFSPGPTAFLVMGKSLNHGTKSVMPLVFGILCGDILAISVSFAGLGILLSASAWLFSAFKWVAATYLIYLGIKSWRTKPDVNCNDRKALGRNKIFKEALIVTVLNPKAIIFFVAFFPLFINTSNPFLNQMVILAGTFLVTSATSAFTYAFCSAYLKNKLQALRVQILFNRISGGLLVGAGAITASIKNQ